MGHVPVYSKTYLKATLREIDHWGNEESDISTNWDNNYIMREYQNEVVTGNPDKDWINYIINKFELKDRARACVLGCGSGDIEKEFVEKGKFREVFFYDISKNALRKMKEKMGMAKNRKYEYIVCDLNHSVFHENQFDFILCNNVLHHIVNLENVLSSISGSLTVSGKFVVRDYIGENRFQWSDQKLDYINLHRKIIGSRLELPTLIKPIKRYNVSDIVETSPFEAIRSKEIMEIIHRTFFDINIEKTCNGFNTFLQGIDLSNPIYHDAIRCSITMDKTVSSLGILNPSTLYGVYSCGGGDCIYTPLYSEKEIKELFCEGVLTKRKIRSIICKTKLGKWFYELIKKVIRRNK